jgi:hypothetical protein
LLLQERICKSPDGTAFNPTDHILIDARHFSNLMDVRSYRGPNNDPDLYLMISKIRSRISNARKVHGSHAKQFNCEILKKQGAATRYTVSLSDDWHVSLAVRVSVELGRTSEIL